VAEAGQDLFMRVVSGNNRARMAFILGDIAAAEQEWVLVLEGCVRLHFAEGIAYALEGMCAIAASRGDGWRAGALDVVAKTIRQTTGVFDAAGVAVYEAPLQALRENSPEQVAAGEQAGEEMSVAEGIALALPGADVAVTQAIARW
jgi:hypothetical protein